MDNKIRFLFLNLGLGVLLLILTTISIFISSLVYYQIGSELLSASLIPVSVLISGIVYSKLTAGEKYRSIIGSGVTGSVLISVILGIQKVMAQSLRQISEINSDLGATNMPLQTNAIVDPNMLFLTTIIAFNTPIIYSTLQKQDKKFIYLALYLIPLTVYIIIPIIF